LAWRIAAWVAVAVGILSLVWTLSRGAWVAAIVSVVIVAAVFVLRRRSSAKLSGAWQIAIVVAILVVGAALTPTFARRAAVLVDPGSTTASWRLSTWRSSVAMTAARPFLGYGPNNFHFAYPAFQAPRQVDGRRGYPIVESAHNLELDTATSFGVPGLILLLLAGGLVAVIVARTAPHRASSPDLPVALGAALLAGTIALQFHYVTMDTGPLLAVVLAGIVCADPAIAALDAGSVGPGSQRALQAVRWTAFVGFALFGAIAVGALGLVAADMAEQRASTLAQRGAPWSVIRVELTRAEALAPWEVQIVRGRGTVATQVLTQRFDTAAASDGMRAFDAALAATPADAVLAAERANLLLAAGIGGKDPRLLEESAAAFEAAQRMDPNTGISLAGSAAAHFALGRTAQAITEFERAVRLSPRYAPAWRNLARAYKSVGRARDSRLATERANRWSQ
jgi:O-antigen ligase